MRRNGTIKVISMKFTLGQEYCLSKKKRKSNRSFMAVGCGNHCETCFSRRSYSFGGKMRHHQLDSRRFVREMGCHPGAGSVSISCRKEKKFMPRLSPASHFLWCFLFFMRFPSSRRDAEITQRFLQGRRTYHAVALSRLHIHTLRRSVSCKIEGIKRSFAREKKFIRATGKGGSIHMRFGLQVTVILLMFDCKRSQTS